jgi:hypothetical protein
VNFIELAELVDRMRSAQKEYFKTRNKEVLARSKALEREVDRQIILFKTQE